MIGMTTYRNPSPPKLQQTSPMNRTVLPVRLATIAFTAVFAVGCGTYPATTASSARSSAATTVQPAANSTTSATPTTSAASTSEASSNSSVQRLLDAWTSGGRGGVAVALASHD